MSDASLVVVGSGIKFIAHLTIEANAYIHGADKVLYLVNEPAMAEWLHRENPQSESLAIHYEQHEKRIDSYHAISEHILTELRLNKHICVVLYGHPTVFAKPALDAVIQAKHEGYYAKILPGISAEDCLFADLLINPGSSGCMSFDATDFLINNRKFDTNSHLILWQISTIGRLDHAKNHDVSKGMLLLKNYLLEHYHPNHEVQLYSAAMYPTGEPQITRVQLEELTKALVSRITTLYIPPLQNTQTSTKFLKGVETEFAHDNIGK